MEFTPTPLAGLNVIKPRVFDDARGFFYESYNSAAFATQGADHAWVQDNHAMSVRGTLRGLHFQLGTGQTKLVRCVHGAVWDVAVDIDPASPTYKQWFGIELSEANRLMLLIPRTFAHGYVVLSDDAEFLYKCDKLYDGKLEYGFQWNDPEIGVKWPMEAFGGMPILSPRDVNAPNFAQCMLTPGTPRSAK